MRLEGVYHATYIQFLELHRSSGVMLPTTMRFVFCAFFIFLVSNVTTAQEIEPGIYLADVESGDVEVRRNDGTGKIKLGKKLLEDFGSAQIFSVSNANHMCQLTLTYSEPYPDAITRSTTVISVGTDHLVVSSRGSNGNEAFTLGAMIHGQQAAERLADFFDVEPVFRVHPGYKIHTRFEPSQEAYKVGDPITLKMIIENVGDTSFSFMDGGMQRGPRNNQFKFIAFSGAGYGRSILDTGDPQNFGGIAALRTVEPGESFEKEIGLNDWFEFEEADTYRITGLFELGFVDEDMRAIWIDHAVGECLVRIEGED